MFETFDTRVTRYMYPKPSDTVEEMGLWLKEAAHGRGLGREAAGALIAWACAQGRFTCIRYPVDRRNLASRKIPEAHRGVIVREFRAISRSGFELDLVEYRIPVRDDEAARRLRA